MQKSKYLIESSEKHFYYQQSARSGKLSVEEYGIYCYLLQYLNKETSTSFPTIETICKDLNTTKKRIIKILKSLKEKGFINWEKGNSHKANTYYFPLHYTKMNSTQIDTIENEECQNDHYNSTQIDTINSGQIETFNGVETTTPKENIKENSTSPDGEYLLNTILNLLKNLNLKENNKNIRLIEKRIKEKESLSFIEKIINTELYNYEWVNKNEYNNDQHKINTCLKFIMEDADKRYFHINPPKDNKLYYGRYTKEEVDNFRLNLSMGEMYPELLEFIQIEQNYNSCNSID